MRSIFGALVGIVLAAPALAGECPNNPTALGISRTITVDPAEHARIGTMQYAETLPLADKEVVLTFDDGPLPPYTNRILETLAAECVKATFFLVGRQSRAYPDMVRHIYNLGHTVATHSQNHPRIFAKLRPLKAHQEIEDGIAAATAALGNPAALAPFFRFPGLGRSPEIEGYLASRGVMVWSADFPADDWTHISAQQVMQRALDRLERKGKGVLLLHDIQPATVLALPELLRQLKARGYRIVHVVPAGPDRPKTVTEPTQWVFRTPPRQWPMVVTTFPEPKLPIASSETFGWPDVFRMQTFIPPKPQRVRVASAEAHPMLGAQLHWPRPVGTPPPGSSTALPVPSLQSFGYDVPRAHPPHIALPRPGQFATKLASGDLVAPMQYPLFWPHPISGRAPIQSQ